MSDTILDGLEYPVIFSDTAPSSLLDVLARQEPSVERVVIVADRRLAARARAFARVFPRSGVRVLGSRLITGGERVKSQASLVRLWRTFADVRVDRGTMIVALGGGTITDLVGFAAATFARGIPWAAVPTTVLGMADAAIGGKTAIDLPSGKNLAGAFWPPRAVVADVAALKTLPARERATGLAEVIKAAVVGDAGLLDAVEAFDARHASSDAWLELIVRAARVKISIVARDPFDRGSRAALNLGHTIGHALEHAAAGRLSHGSAVSIGLRAAGLLALKAGTFSRDQHARVLRALAGQGLPLSWSGARREAAVYRALDLDKKRAGHTIGFIIPERIGAVKVGVAVERSALRSTIRQCALPPQAEELME
jgi:3-dehydroquinate synthase